jgi:hypothetical protein
VGCSSTRWGGGGAGAGQGQRLNPRTTTPPRAPTHTPLPESTHKSITIQHTCSDVLPVIRLSHCVNGLRLHGARGGARGEGAVVQKRRGSRLTQHDSRFTPGQQPQGSGCEGSTTSNMSTRDSNNPEPGAGSQGSSPPQPIGGCCGARPWSVCVGLVATVTFGFWLAPKPNSKPNWKPTRSLSHNSQVVGKNQTR